MWRSKETAIDELPWADRPPEPENGFDTLQLAALIEHCERCGRDIEARVYLFDIFSSSTSRRSVTMSTQTHETHFVLNSGNIMEEDLVEVLFNEVIPFELRDDVAQRMCFSKIGRWYGNEVNLLRNPDSPSVPDWEMAQADAEEGIAYYATFSTKPIDYARAITWYSSNNKLPPQLSSEDHIANVMRLNGVSKEVAIQQIEAAKERRHQVGEIRNQTAREHLQEIVQKLKTGVEGYAVTSFHSNPQEVDKLLTTAIACANQRIEWAKQQIAGLPDVDMQERYKATQLLIEAGKVKIKGVWHQCQDVLEQLQNSGYPPVEDGVH